MGYLSNIILDIDLELQRFLQGLGTTRRSNSVIKAKTDHRNECKNKYLNGFLSAGEYLNAIYLTIGRDYYILGNQPQVQDISDSLSDSNECRNSDIVMFVYSLGVKTSHSYMITVFTVAFFFLYINFFPTIDESVYNSFPALENKYKMSFQS